jgi:hypothetical protein
MESFFQWYNLIYYASLFVGIILSSLSALDVDLDMDDVPSSFFQAFGIGKIPIMITIVIICLVFGFFGNVFNYVFSINSLSTSFDYIKVFLLSFITSIIFHSFTAYLFNNIFKDKPNKENKIIGSNGVLRTKVSKENKKGLANFYVNGDVFQHHVYFEDLDVDLIPLTDITAVGYNEETKEYLVERKV